MKAGLDKLATQASQKAQIIMAEIMEPFESFQKQYQTQQTDFLTRAKDYWQQLEDHRVQLEIQQDRYYRLSSDAEQSDVEIE